LKQRDYYFLDSKPLFFANIYNTFTKLRPVQLSSSYTPAEMMSHMQFVDNRQHERKKKLQNFFILILQCQEDDTQRSKQINFFSIELSYTLLMYLHHGPGVDVMITIFGDFS
jgi:hypothetical protein